VSELNDLQAFPEVMVTKLWAGQLGFNSWQRFVLFSLRYRVQISSETHPASYPTPTWSSFSGGKTAGA
jgi:hypothetical protein